MKMRTMIPGLVLMFAAEQMRAQSPEWVWANALGDTTDVDVANHSAIDPWGYTLVVGRFDGTIDAGATQLVSAGGADAFIGKLDPLGNWIWARSFGSTEYEALVGLAVDAQGNSYVTGAHQGTVDIGLQTLDVNGGGDLLVAKIDSAGNWLWATHTTGSGSGFGRDVSVDDEGNVYVSGDVVMEEIAGEDTVSSAGTIAPVVGRLDDAGNWIWFRAFNSTGGAYGYAVAALDSGGAILAGGFLDTMFVAQDTLLAGAAISGYVIKIDDQGGPLWSRRTAGSSSTLVRDIAVDQLARIFLVGSSATGNAIIGDTTFVVADGGNGCIARLSAAGTWAWARMTEGLGTESFTSIALHPDGYVLVTGGYYDGDALLGNTALPNLGGTDILTSALTLGGAWLLAQSAGGAGDDQGLSISAGIDGAVSVCGTFSDTADFGMHELITNGGIDAFVGKLDVLLTAIPAPASTGFAPWLATEADAYTLVGLGKGPAIIRMLDATGREVGRFSGTAINGRLSLGNLDLSAGAFLVQVQQGEQRATLKFVVR